MLKSKTFFYIDHKMTNDYVMNHGKVVELLTHAAKIAGDKD